jgi:superfamily II DNA or RNA helicase
LGGLITGGTRMKIYIDSQIHIEDATKEVIDFIKRELEIPNPELSKKMAMGFYYRDTPKKIKAYSKNENTYVIPIGEIDNIWRLHPHIEDYTLNFGQHKKLEFPENTLKLYDYQEKAVAEAVKFKRGILSSKCGSGKSIMALEIIKRIGYKALIVCEKKEILEQFVGYLKNIFNMKKGEYGVIQEGKVEIGSLVTVALRQTLARIDLTPYKFEFGTIMVDEAQNVRTDQLQNALNIL